MGEEGLEPSIPCGNEILSLASDRNPIHLAIVMVHPQLSADYLSKPFEGCPSLYFISASFIFFWLFLIQNLYATPRPSQN